MKTIKSVLIVALVALLGSSAQAAGAAVLFDCGKVNISQNTTNNLCWTEGDVVHYLKESDVKLDASESKQHDTEIAKIVVTNGVVCITGAGRDGDTEVTLLSADGEKLYVYEVSAITITLSKTVKAWNESDCPEPWHDENNKSNATISIISHILNNPKPKIPNVLLLGTLCSAHDLSRETILNTLNGITSVANLDYYLFNKSGGDTATFAVHKTFAKGATIADNTDYVPELTHGNGAHCSLTGFYNVLDSIRSSGVQYDYIVFETDGSRLAWDYGDHGSAGNNCGKVSEEKQKTVATYLAPFFADQRVIFVLDNGVDYYHTEGGLTATDSYYFKLYTADKGYAQEIFQYGSDVPRGARKYRVSNIFANNSGGEKQYLRRLNDTQWKALLGVFDPQLYLDIATNKQTKLYAGDDGLISNAKFYGQTAEAQSSIDRTMDLYAGHPYDIQLWYDNAETIGKDIAGMIKPVEYTTDLADTVLRVQNTELRDTMTIVDGENSVRLYKWTKILTPGPQDDPYADGWVQIPSKDAGITVTGNSISNNVSGITNECYTLLQIDIRIADDFLKSAIAYKEKWESEHNDDYPDNITNAWTGIVKAADYETSHKWKVNPNDGDAKITVWRGQGGAKVLAQTCAAAMSNAWEQEEQAQNFLVDSTDAYRVYDGIMTNIFVAVTNADEKVKTAVIEYRKVGDSDWIDYEGATKGFTDVVNTNVEFRISGVDGYVDYYGTNTVTITPKAVMIASGSKTDFTYDGEPHAHTNLTVEGFVAGEGLVTTTDWATVTTVAEGPKDNAFSYTLKDNTLEGNYTFTVMTGKIAVAAAPITPKQPGGTGDNPGEEPAEDPSADPSIWARNIVKCYDGIGTNVIAKVYNAVDGNKFTYLYSTDESTGFVDWDELQFTNVVAAQKVWYTAVNAEGNYLNVTNFAYVTITQRVVSAANGVIADPTNKVYLAAAPDLTNHKWTGPAAGALAEGDYVDTVGFAWTNDVAEIKDLYVGEYPAIITTNGPNAIVIRNAAGEDVSANYVMGFTPGTLKVTKEKGYVEPIPDDPTGRIYKGEGWTPDVTATNSVGHELTKGADYTTEYFNNTNAVDKGAFVVVTFKGNYEGVVTNYFSIYPKAVTITSGTRTDFTYDGKPHAYTNLAVTAGGFVTGEGLATTTDWATVTTVAEGPKDNTFEYTLKDNTVPGNYTITVVTGEIAVVKAPIAPKEPGDDPGDAPKPGDGPTVWAQNVIAEWFDGISTNIVPQVYNAQSGNEFTFLFSTNKDDAASWTADLAFTDIVATQKVWYAAIPQGDTPNYLAVTNYAFVTIWGREAETKGNGVELPKQTSEAMEDDLAAIIITDPQVEEAEFLKVQLTVSDTSALDETTRTSPTESAVQRGKIAAEAADDAKKAGFELTASKAFDIVLEKSYNAAVKTESYNKDHWVDIGDDNEVYVTVILPYEEPKPDEVLLGIYKCHKSAAGNYTTTKLLERTSEKTLDDIKGVQAECFAFGKNLGGVDDKNTVVLRLQKFSTVSFVYGKKVAPPPHSPCAPTAEEDVARVFQMQLNVYTTEGRAVGGIGGSQCAPGGCIVIRGKGKAMLRGYVFVCGSACELTDYLDVFCDAYHAGAFFNNVLKAEDPTDVEPCLKWSLVHAIGKNMADAETAWTFKGTVNYDPKSESPRTATYELAGAGYGQFNGEMFNDFSGCFAGTVSQTFDHTSPKTSANAACLCAPSMVVLCDSNGAWVADDEGSVAFGKWKMKYNASASKAYAAGRWNPITAITKAMAH